MLADLSLVPFLVICLSSFVSMEVIAWAGHKYVLHGPGWWIHKSHHAGKTAGVERNDLVALCFGAIAAAFFIAGGWHRNPATALGLGMTLYGALYALVHDGIAHRRWGAALRVRHPYLKRLVQAHRLHHATHDRDGAVSFGFLYAQPIPKLRRKLRSFKGASRRQYA